MLRRVVRRLGVMEVGMRMGGMRRLVGRRLMDGRCSGGERGVEVGCVPHIWSVRGEE
jgi:hypothetical protein